MAGPFRSKRLLYRAVESPEDDTLFHRIQTEPISYENSNANLLRPQSRADAAKYQNHVAKEALLGVVICIPPPPEAIASQPTPIGTVHLKAPFSPNVPHRFTELGIDVLEEFQGKGYGTEAIEWAIDWAFNIGGLHRMNIKAFEWNEGARRLYERIGFKHEGTSRELLWHKGRWWDDYQYGMLSREWEEIRARKER